MAELAFNINGERFDLPASASCWRVRRFKASGRGTPEVVFGDDGLPLIIPIDTEIGEFRTQVRNVPGRYRLDAVDEDQKTCEDGTGAYVQLSDEVSSGSSATAGSGRSEGDELLREIVRANADMVKVIAEKFATVMDSAATLLRAADGAGMPSREAGLVPLQLANTWRNAEQPESRQDDDDDYDGDDEPSGTMHLARVIENVATQAMPLVKHHIHTKFMGLSPEQSIAMMEGWELRRAPAPRARARVRPRRGRARPVMSSAPARLPPLPACPLRRRPDDGGGGRHHRRWCRRDDGEERHRDATRDRWRRCGWRGPARPGLARKPGDEDRPAQAGADHGQDCVTPAGITGRVAPLRVDRRVPAPAVVGGRVDGSFVETREVTTREPLFAVTPVA